MEIKLLQLSIQNFQGIKEFILKCDGEDRTVLGDNATGKTTIKNAFTWLLFNKNSKGVTKFGVRPRDEEGNLIHGLETSVEGVFLVDSEQKTFKRSINEKVSTVRGTSRKSYKETSEWFVDGVPKKKNEYEKAVSSLIDENIFKMITDPWYFNTQMKWDERRRILMDICGDIPDEEILKSTDELKELETMLNGRTVEDFREITAHAIKPVAEQLKKIPVQIAEAERAKPSADDLEYDEGQREYLLNLIENKETTLADIKHGAAITQKRERIKQLNDQLTSAGKPFSESECEEFSKFSELRQKNVEHQLKINNIGLTIDRAKKDLEINAIDRNKLSEEWDAVYFKEFTGNICPTCHQSLPPDEVEAHRKEFNIAKARDLDRIEMKLNVLKEEKEKLEKSLSENQKALDDTNKENKDTLSEMERLHAAIFKKREEYDQNAANQIARIKQEIRTIEAEIKSIEENSAVIVEKLEAEIAGFRDEKNAIDEKVANRALIEKQEARIKELSDDEKRLAREHERLQHQLYLCDEFTRRKADMLTERINANFQLARFKLFEIQKNEGIKETCEVTYEGIPFTDLNNAGCINIGLDIINTLCKRFDVQAPILIDNSESVTQLFDTFSQKIMLKVDENAKKLTVV